MLGYLQGTAQNWPPAAASLLLALVAGVAQAQVPAHITKALADPSRPAADLSRDAARKAGEIVAVDATGEGKDDTFTFEGARHASAIEVPVITAGTATGTE